MIYFGIIVIYGIFLACPFVGGLGIGVALNYWMQIEQMKNFRIFRCFIGCVGGLIVGWSIANNGILANRMECYYCSMFGLGLILGSFLPQKATIN